MSQSNTHLRGILLAAGGMILISPDGLFFRLVEASDLQILFWRGLVSFAVITLWLQVTRPGGLLAALRHSGRPGLACTGLMTVSVFCFVTSITRTDVANTLIVLATIPLFAAVFGWLFLRIRVRTRTWAAMGAAFVGIVVVFGGSLGAALGGGGSLIGDLLALGAAVSLAANLVIIRAHPGISMLPALAISGLLAAVLAAPFIDSFEIAARDFALIAVMGIVFQAIAFALFLAAGRYLPPAEVGLFALLETVLGPLWAWLGVGEVPSSSALVGGAIVIAALALHSIASLRRAGAARR